MSEISGLGHQVDERDLRNLNDTECRDCGEDMTYAQGFGWVCQNCIGGGS